ncbi:MAG: glycosyltransferase [Bacteroidales bacterium]|nr:glycosyltransferase [Bacteroidales bacterium]
MAYFTMKLLSVIIPLYNSAKWLPKCLDSVLDQDVPLAELEVICINDGSPDNSEEIALKYQQKYPNTIVVLSQENQGPSGARNNGMKHATGKYLCFVDPDDYVEPQVFGGLIKKMTDDGLDMLRFNYQIVDENYKPVEKREFEKQFDYSPCVMSGAEFLANRLDIACNIWRYMYRTELITANEIWCFTGDYFDDTPWLPLVLMKAERLDICDTVVYDYQERSDSLVKANSLPRVKKKNQGFLLLIRLLLEEIKGLRGEKVSYDSMKVLRNANLSSDLCDKIVLWYQMMIAHCVISLLTSVAIYEYKSRRYVFKELNDLGVFPLSSYRASAKNINKIRAFNSWPRLMMGIIHLKNNCKR